MHTLTPGTGCIFIKLDALKSIPFGLGALFPVFDETAQTMAIHRLYNINAPLVNSQLYSSYNNGLTGVPFASFDELLTFVGDHFFITGAAVPGLTGVEASIVAVPVASNEFVPGTSINIAALTEVTGKFQLMIITPTTGGGASLYVKNVHYTVAGTTITFLGGSSFLVDDQVFIISTN